MEGGGGGKRVAYLLTLGSLILMISLKNGINQHYVHTVSIDTDLIC